MQLAITSPAAIPVPAHPAVLAQHIEPDIATPETPRASSMSLQDATDGSALPRPGFGGDWEDMEAAAPPAPKTLEQRLIEAQIALARAEAARAEAEATAISRRNHNW
jgi:hypothetical protein